jgi:predicted nucleic acid-binding protein
LSIAVGYLLDTNLISETRKNRAEPGVIAFLAAADAAGLFLSVLTLGELRKRVEGKRRTDSDTTARLGARVDGIHLPQPPSRANFQ